MEKPATCQSWLQPRVQSWLHPAYKPTKNLTFRRRPVWLPCSHLPSCLQDQHRPQAAQQGSHRGEALSGKKNNIKTTFLQIFYPCKLWFMDPDLVCISEIDKKESPNHSISLLHHTVPTNWVKVCLWNYNLPKVGFKKYWAELLMWR